MQFAVLNRRIQVGLTEKMAFERKRLESGEGECQDIFGRRAFPIGGTQVASCPEFQRNS